MGSELIIRSATPEDIPAMVSIYFSAFSSSPLSERCFPASSPETHTFWATWLAKIIGGPTNNHLIVAVLPASPGSPARLAGWARWVRKPAPTAVPHPPKFAAADYPSSGDGEFAARFFQSNYEATERVVAGQDHWFLSMIMTGREFQRRGIGTVLMRYGVEKADMEGWMAYVNSSEDGKRLYESFGFYVAERSEFEPGMTQYHMKRDAKKES